MTVPQTKIWRFQPLGVPGDLADDSPRRLVDGVLASSDATNNAVQRVFTYVNSTPVTSAVMNVQAGGTAASSSNFGFAGFLVNSKEYALYGTAGNPLAPSLTLPNGKTVALMQQGRIFASLPVNNSSGGNNSPSPNDTVIYNTTTGELDSIKPGASMPSGFLAAHATVVLIDPNIPAGYTPTQTSVLSIIDINYNPNP